MAPCLLLTMIHAQSYSVSKSDGDVREKGRRHREPDDPPNVLLTWQRVLADSVLICLARAKAWFAPFPEAPSLQSHEGSRLETVQVLTRLNSYNP